MLKALHAGAGCSHLVYGLAHHRAWTRYVHAHISRTARAEHVAAIEAYMGLVCKEPYEFRLRHTQLTAIKEHEERCLGAYRPYLRIFPSTYFIISLRHWRPSSL